jgi:mRNA interferase MazF
VRAAGFTPDRGDIVWLAFAPQAGREQAGRRPALVLSPSRYNEKVGLAICCPITSHEKGYPFEVALLPGLAVSGVVLADQVKNLDWRSRHATFIARMPDDLLDEVLLKLAALLQIPA